MNSIKILIFTLTLFIFFTSPNVALTQSGGKVWIGLDQSHLGDSKIFRHTFSKDGFFDFDTSKNWMCVRYSGAYDYMKETGIAPKTLQDFIQEKGLQSNDKIICEKIDGFKACVPPLDLGLCLDKPAWRLRLANQISQNVPQMKDKNLSFLAEVKSSMPCLEGDQILNQSSVKFSNTNLFYYCIKDPDGIHTVNLCEAGQQSCRDISSIRNQSCNLEANENKKCDYLTCLDKETNALRYQEAFTTSSIPTTKDRTLFCVPSDNYTESQKIICSSKINTPSGLQDVDYDMATDSIANTASIYKDVCKYQDRYLAEGPSRTLKESITDQSTTNTCSLATSFDDEMRKTDKVNCTNPTKCEAENFFSRGGNQNIYCIGESSDFTKGVKYACKTEYKHKGDSWWPCISIATTKIENYADASKAIKLTGDFCGAEPPCKKLDEYYSDFKESVTVGRKVNRLLPLEYTSILQRVAQVLYGTAIFLFVFLMIINGIHLVRSGSSPEELKKAKEGIFNAIAGFLFVLFSGGFIISIINSIQK